MSFCPLWSDSVTLVLATREWGGLGNEYERGLLPVSGEGPHASDNSPGETKLHLFRCALLVNVARGLVVKPAISSFEHGGHTEIGER